MSQPGLHLTDPLGAEALQGLTEFSHAEILFLFRGGQFVSRSGRTS
jgi:tRNA (Thr-GGU) A37 N-methylase